MRLDLLLDREPFLEIFSKTLSSYLFNRFNWDGEVRWNKREPQDNKSFFVNTKLNLIYPQTFDVNILRQLASEYSYNPNFILGIAQRFYAYFAISKPVQEFLSAYYLSINPLPEVCNHWCILPGNNGIRIVDVKGDECIVLQKNGFNEKYMRNLISLRKQYPDLPGPRLFRFNLADGWYAEERISGLPLNRLGDKLRIASALESARKSMVELYDQTSSSVDFAVWSNMISKNIYHELNDLVDEYPLSLRIQIKCFVKNLISHLAEIHSQEQDLEIVQSHGDFQPANILIPSCSDQGSFYLIDWEYTEKRCRWYDAMVFELRSRSPKGLAHRISHWLSNNDCAFNSIKWCGIDQTVVSARFAVGTFLLEELLFRFSDTSIPGSHHPNKEFLRFIDELLSINMESFS